VQAYIPYAGTACESETHRGARWGRTLEYEQAAEVLTAPRHWLGELSMKSTPEAILKLAQQFAQQQPDGTWAQLLGAPNAPLFVCTDDVGAFAVVLMHREFKLGGEAASRYYEVVTFFAAAANRLAIVCAPDLKPHPFFSREAYLASGSDS
jgi:hypothetical protein